MKRDLARALAVAAGGVVMVAATIASAPATTQATTWTMAADASAPPSGALTGVSCPTTTFCAAVGYYDSGDGQGNKAEAWVRLSDHKWHTSAVPANVTRSMQGVSCLSASFCLAVTNQNTTGTTYAYRWNGRSWIGTTALPLAAGDHVTAVSCVSTVWCLAVGSRAAFDGSTTARVWRWNGARWDEGSAPRIGGTAPVELHAVACRATNFCVVAGQWSYGYAVHPLVATFNGTKWGTAQPAVGAAYNVVILNGVSCPSTGECVVVGGESTTGSTSTSTYPFTSRLTGGAWHAESAPGQGTNSRLLSVSCAASGSCTAVGGSPDLAPGSPMLTVTRSGGAWSRGNTPPVSSSRSAVAASASCSSTANCVAVGGLFDTSDSDVHEAIAAT